MNISIWQMTSGQLDRQSKCGQLKLIYFHDMLKKIYIYIYNKNETIYLVIVSKCIIFITEN